MMTKFQWLRKQKKLQKFLKSYHVMITLTAFMLLAFSNLQDNNEMNSDFGSRGPASVHKKSFFAGFAKEFHKPKQAIEVDADYEKLSQNQQTRVTGKISSAIFTDEQIHYQWVLQDNVVLLSNPESLSGEFNMNTPMDISVDVQARDPNKPIKMQLQASAVVNNTKYGNVKNIILNTQDLTEMQSSEKLQQRTMSTMGMMSKEEAIRQELESNEKFTPRQ